MKHLEVGGGGLLAQLGSNHPPVFRSTEPVCGWGVSEWCECREVWVCGCVGWVGVWGEENRGENIPHKLHESHL